MNNNKDKITLENFLRNEVEWRLESMNDYEEGFNEIYGHLSKNKINKYVKEIVNEIFIEDFIDYDKLDNKIYEILSIKFYKFYNN